MVKEYIDKIVEKGKKEDMNRLSEIMEELICGMKEAHKDLYNKYKMELYIMANGKVLTEEMAEKKIHEMKPYGMKWTLEQTKDVQNQYGLSNIRSIDFWIVMNMAYNDYHEMFDEDIESYVKFTKMFIQDQDGKEDKVFTYFTM